MSAAEVLTGAWGGDPARKQASIATARAALAAGPVVMCNPTLRLAAPGQADDVSNVYCAAYGTADPAELEARSGLPVSTLMLASAALRGCEHWSRVGDGVPRMVGGTGEAPIVALEAIRAGADPVALARHYVVDLLAQLAAVQDSAGQGLSPEQQALVRHLATLHEEGCTDPATFRALRRTATAATDAAAGDLEGAVLRFAESVAWPLAGLVRELAEFAMRVHMELRSHLALERPSPAEQATLEAVSVMYGATTERLQADPKLDFKAEFAKIEATPEFAAANDAAFQAQLEHYDLVAAEAYAPFAVELLLGAFRKA